MPENLKLWNQVQESELVPGFQFKYSNRSYKVYTVIGLIKDEEFNVNIYVTRYIDETNFERYEMFKKYQKDEED